MGGWHVDHIQNSDVVELAGIYDIKEERQELARSRGIRAYSSREELLADPEIEMVTVATPNDVHEEIAIAALEAGKNVLSEKPVTLSLESLERMIAASKKAGKIFSVHQNRRFDVDYLAMKKLRDSGEIGEIINIEGWFERFGEWLKIKTGNSGDANFVSGFVTASLTVSIGAMAVVGSIQDGILGDWSILGIKSLLDMIIIMVMTCSMGKGCGFSAIPVFILEGGMTLLAAQLKGIMTDTAMGNLSMIGSILIFCVGLNLIWGKKIRVANMLPALVFAMAAAFLPFSL